MTHIGRLLALSRLVPCGQTAFLHTFSCTYVLIDQGNSKHTYSVLLPPGSIEYDVLLSIGQGNSKRTFVVLVLPGPCETCVVFIPFFACAQTGMLFLMDHGHAKHTLVVFYYNRANRTTFSPTMFSFP